MEFDEAKQRFLTSWGILGSSWGINKTMAQIHALLLIASEPMSTEDVMKELSISRGNANMNIRALMDWRLVEKVIKPGERKEFFEAEKDIWQVTLHITRERRKREIEPILRLLDEMGSVEGDGAEVEEFKKVTSDLQVFTHQADNIMEKLSKSDRIWYLSLIKKLL